MEQALKALKPIAAGNINSVISDAAYAAATSLIAALAEPAPPAEVPMLTSEDRTAVVMHAERIYAEDSNGSWRNAIMSATEQAVRQKAGLQ